MSRPGENAELRSRLLGVKLKALVSDHLGRSVDVEPARIPSGAGLVVDGRAWVLIDGDAARSLGPALAWTIRQDASSLDLIADSSTGLLGRRAAQFDFPISVWFAEERTLLPGFAEQHVDQLNADSEHLALSDMIEQGGADASVEHGIVTGEVRGLEVCRVVDEATIGRLIELGEIDMTGRVGDEGVRLEVGVGANDREAFQLLHGDIPTVEALAGVVESVRAHRSMDAPQHPLNRMAPERFLRWSAAERPDIVNLKSLRSVAPPVVRPSMKDQAPAVGLGTDHDDNEHVVVFSSGVDLDLIPFALDAQRALISWGHDRLVPTITIALRENDLVQITRDVADLADSPIDFATMR